MLADTSGRFSVMCCEKRQDRSMAAGSRRSSTLYCGRSRKSSKVQPRTASHQASLSVGMAECVMVVHRAAQPAMVRCRRSARRNPVVFVRHRRARRYILRVLADGTLRVTLPRWGAKRDAAAFVEASRDWIADSSSDKPARAAATTPGATARGFCSTAARPSRDQVVGGTRLRIGAMATT